MSLRIKRSLPDRSVAMTASRLRQDGYEELAAHYSELDLRYETHMKALRALHRRVQVGAGLGDIEHGALLADWLMDEGWTPPEEVFVLEVVADPEEES